MHGFYRLIGTTLILFHIDKGYLFLILLIVYDKYRLTPPHQINIHIGMGYIYTTFVNHCIYIMIHVM